MNTESTHTEQFESTYALIVRSEEKQRSRLEMVLYTLLVVSCVFALSQFGRQAVTLPSSIVRNSSVASVVQRS